MAVVADRLSIRWYLGYDLHEPLLEHSTLTRIRDRYGLETFRRFFEEIIERCAKAGLVWGEELYFDATKIEANASLESIVPRFAVEQHLQDLFEEDPQDSAGALGDAARAALGVSMRSRPPKTRSSPSPMLPRAIGSQGRVAKIVK